MFRRAYADGKRSSIGNATHLRRAHSYNEFGVDAAGVRSQRRAFFAKKIRRARWDAPD
jgi:hypothetical protein